MTNLAAFRGPASGVVELPLWLYWSRPRSAFDLAEPYMRRWLYQTVLREAARPEDLTGFLNRDILLTEGQVFHLSAGVRQAWDGFHPVLRTAAAA